MNKLRKPSNTELAHSLESQKIEAGMFGIWFGTGASAKINVTASAVIVLVASGIVYSFTNDLSSAIEYWKIVTPFITLGFGYIWGKNSD